MKTTFEDISSIKKKMTVEIESGNVDQKINEAYRELGKRARVPGFRPGKVPRKILEQRFGDDIADDVTKNLIGDSFPQAVSDVNVTPLGTPLIEKEIVKQGQPFTYSVIMEIRPKFEVKDYLGVEVEKELYEITDEAVSSRVEQIRQSNGKLQSVEEDRPVKNDDHVVLDYVSFEGETPLDDVKASNFLLKVGSNNFHPKFEEGLVGLKKQDEAGIKVDFEGNYYHSKLAGKSILFKVKVIDIKQMVLPELNDEFAKNLGAGFNTMEELKANIKESLAKQEEKRVEEQMRGRLIAKIAKGVDFEIPQVLVESELDYAIETYKQNLAWSGSSLEKVGISEEKLRADMRPVTERRVKEMLVIEEIAQQDKITVNDEDMENKFKELAAGMGQTPAVIRQYYEAKNLMESLRYKLAEEKTLNYLVQNARIQSVESDMLAANA
ncbi:Trigger factor [uncultured Desulfobacterium sp.]|uniref:Trigger factor n=1 Tax=uncultured Desulfobacterium sp. TaxID=201089 RepID=A0A445MRD7_9BACT|nr:Trigger factor [uncultured Desulfobacterium sp.]